MRLLDSDLLPTLPLQVHDFPIGTGAASVAVLPHPVTATTSFVSPLQSASEEYDGDFDFDLDLEDDDEAEDDDEVEDDDDDEEDDDDDDDDEFPSEDEDDD